MTRWLLFFTIFFIFRNSDAKPEQVVLSFTGEPTTMAVTWITLKPLNAGVTPFVNYGLKKDALTETVAATTTKWTDQGKAKMVRYTYRATMTGLVPGVQYHYEVGSSQSTSDTFHFTALDPKNITRVCIYGDLSIKDGYSIPPMTEAAHRGDFDLIVHIGDIAYSLDDNDGTKGDDFMNAIENMTARVPFMVIPGNHEEPQNFSHIVNRYTMPKNGIFDNLFWSFTLGDAHFVGISSEFYGFNISNFAQLQYSWLLNDLKKSKATWKVLFMHRPMYCSTDGKKGCHDWEHLSMRDGAPGYPALEPLFNAGGVDLVFWGHQHSYERSWPVAKSTVYLQPDSKHYHNASTPVYIMTGAAGCHSHQEVELKIRQPFTAEMLGEYGYTVLTVASSSELTTHFVDVKKDNILDKFSLTKDPGFVPGVPFF